MNEAPSALSSLECHPPDSAGVEVDCQSKPAHQLGANESILSGCQEGINQLNLVGDLDLAAVQKPLAPPAVSKFKADSADEFQT